MLKNGSIKLYILFFALFTAFFLSSCESKKDSQTNLMNHNADAKLFALSLYGDEVKLVANGDLLADGSLCAVAAIVRKQTGNSFWIQRGSFIRKDKDGWKVLLKLEEKLTTVNGELVEQVEAKNGYIISIDTVSKPAEINIVMSNETGEGSSDDAVIKWNKTKNDFEFTAPFNDIPQ